ncbi:MAG: hypothetical protein AAGD32_16115, partial [Planctomycetota bacterium]
GSLLWTKQLGGSGFETIGDLTTNDTGEPILTGGFFGTADFDPSTDQFKLTSTRGDDDTLGDDDANTGDRDAFSYDTYVVRLDVDGRFGGAVSFGGVGDDYGQSVLIRDGMIGVAGFFEDTFDGLTTVEDEAIFIIELAGL